jgi:CHAD domain-containing protein
MRSNVEGVADQHDEESVHQMRVGMRRLHSALSMYKDVLHVPADIQQELDWLAGELGAARDWDVLSGTTLPALAKEVRDPRPVDEVMQAAAETAREHHATAAAAVGSPRYTELMLKMNRWIESTGWRQDPAAPPKADQLDAPVVKFARQIGKRDERRLRKRAANLPTATPEARHRVRIAAKKARYATEFFGSLFAPKTVRPYVKALSGLQDELGYLNDAAVAERLLTEMSTAKPQLESSVSFTKGFLAARVKNEDKKVLKLWRRFEPVARPH